jgi:hypothetical protein
LQPGSPAPSWVLLAPILVALGVVAVLANVSAVLRLRHIARAAEDRRHRFSLPER